MSSRTHSASIQQVPPQLQPYTPASSTPSMRSEEFRTRWASHNVRFHNTGTKRFMHPLVGELTLNFERFDLAAENGLTMFTYAAEPGTRSAEGLDLLASWTATPHAPESNRSHLEPGAK